MLDVRLRSKVVCYLGIACREGHLYILHRRPVVVEAEEGGRPVGQGQAQLRLGVRRREDSLAVQSQGGLTLTAGVLLVSQLSVNSGLDFVLPEHQLRQRTLFLANIQ